ncbi:MAG TPA: response regulator [Chloroflexota bacterium]|jgi:DNA-binding NtrC family response regulator|nr:response regulator [Chloroflexota bacterium]
MPYRDSTVLLIEHDPDLREIEQLVLTEAGYRVETPSAPTDPVSFAERTQPDLIVIGIRPARPRDWQTLVSFKVHTQTRTIPVVAISTSSQMAAAAQATSLAEQSIVAPFDIETLENALAQALDMPPSFPMIPFAAQRQLAIANDATDIPGRGTRQPLIPFSR